MHALVVYESMYGNTHAVAEAIGRGIQEGGHRVEVVPVAQASHEVVGRAGLLIVGGPTHIHSMSSTRSRQGAVDTAHAPGSELELDPDAEGEGLREWFDHLPESWGAAAAAFDTRRAGPPLLTGRASKGISHRLQRHGFDEVAEPESFLVDQGSHLVDGEEARATAWGRSIAETVHAIGAPPEADRQATPS